MEIAAAGVGVEFSGRPILSDVSFTVARGDRWGIVGRNGSGKTTLVRLITGLLEPTFGTLTRASGVRFTLLDQHREFPNATSVWEAAATPFADLMALESSLETQAHALAEPGGDTPSALARYDRDLERFGRDGGYEYRARIDAVLDGLGFPHEAARTQSLSQLSGGELGRVGLAQQLVAPADILLLDEPTNHLDIDTTRWLEEYLQQIDATVMVISHDRAFLQAVANHILHVEHGTATPYDTDYAGFVRLHAERQYAQQRAFDLQQKVIASEEDFIRRNLAGQNTKQAQGRRTKLARLPRLSAPLGADARTMALRLEPNARGGNQVLVATSVTIAVGERVLIRDFTARIERGDVIGLIGANGTGKSTLLRVVNRRPTTAVAATSAAAHADQSPTARADQSAAARADTVAATGDIRVGESIDAAYYRQDLAQVPMGITLFDIVHNLRPSWERGQVQSHLGRFGFSGEAAQRVADNLSGGERARVALAMLMLSHANFLMFDEPTNHLDVESIEALEDALETFDGTVLLVSHDRALLSAMTNRIWFLENGRIEDFRGTFDEWDAARHARLAAHAREAEELRDARAARERQLTRQREQQDRSARTSVRELKQRVAQAEHLVESCEARVLSLRTQLEDSALYATAEGARQAAGINAELAVAVRALDDAIESWTVATEALENAGS